MSKRIVLYFTNEDEAESARASLNTLKTNRLTIEEIPDDANQGTLLPFLTANLNTSNMSGIVAQEGLEDTFLPFTKEEERDRKITHLLQVEVAEEDYKKLLELMSHYDCYIRNNEI